MAFTTSERDGTIVFGYRCVVVVLSGPESMSSSQSEIKQHLMSCSKPVELRYVVMHIS